MQSLYENRSDSAKPRKLASLEKRNVLSSPILRPVVCIGKFFVARNRGLAEGTTGFLPTQPVPISCLRSLAPQVQPPLPSPFRLSALVDFDAHEMLSLESASERKGSNRQ